MATVSHAPRFAREVGLPPTDSKTRSSCTRPQVLRDFWLQRRVVEQLHMVEADAGEAEAALNALLDDEASKLRILDYLRKWLGDKLEEMPANRV